MPLKNRIRKDYVQCKIIYTGWSKSLCAPDDYNTYVRCTKTFWSPCI